MIVILIRCSVYKVFCIRYGIGVKYFGFVVIIVIYCNCSKFVDNSVGMC